MAVTYSTYQSFPVGTVLVSGTDEYITEIKYCSGNESVLLESREAQPLPAVIHQCLNELHEYFEGSRQQFSFPVSQQGTPFQQKVWQELMVIPFGVTISYLELSKRLGDIKAIRAAASANGKNKLNIIVPCHRVIGSNQDLVGYGGGLGIKKWLLQHEAKIAHGVQTLF